MSDAPIFVAGFPRSGTTLLQSLLGTHPAIAAPPELHWFLRIEDQRAYWGDLSDDATVRRVVEATVSLPGGLLDDARFDVDSITARACAGPRTYPSVLAAVMEDYADRRGKRRWSEKTPEQLPDRIWAAFPDAQVVHIVRDPRDVVASVRRAPFTSGGRTAVDVARSWVAFHEASARAGARRGAEHYRLVRYEDLCGDVDGVMADIFAFLGERADVAALHDPAARAAAVSGTAWWTHNATRPVLGPSHSGDRLALGVRGAVGVITAPLLRALGYRAASPAERLAGRVVLGGQRLRRTPRADPRMARTPTPQEHHDAVARLIDETVARAMRHPH